MFNVGGIGNYNKMAGPGKFDSAKTVKQDKKNEKSANTDKADFSSALKNKQTAGNYGAMRVDKADEKAGGLSRTAKEYLEKLRKKYGNMDFIVADFSSDEEAEKLLGKGKGEYNVLITPDLLEKMAADESVAAEYEGLIEESVGSIEEAKSALGDDADMVEKFGVSIDADGKLALHAKLIEGLTNSDGGRSVKASTVEEMLDSLKSIKEEQSEKLEKLREQKAEAAKKQAEKLEAKKEKETEKSGKKPEHTPFSAEA